MSSYANNIIDACRDMIFAHRRSLTGRCVLPAAPHPWNLTVDAAEARVKALLGDDEISTLAREALYRPKWPSRKFHTDEKGRILEPYWVVEENKQECAKWCRDRETAWAALAEKVGEKPVAWLTYRPV